MATCPADVVDARRVKDAFWIMTPCGLDLTSLFLGPNGPLAPSSILPTLQPDTKPFGAFYAPTLCPDTLWTVHPEHIGFFLSETYDFELFRKYGADVLAQWTSGAVAFDQIEDMQKLFFWAREQVKAAESLDWDTCSTVKQDIPKHICYLFLCEAVVGAVKASVSRVALSDLYGIATACHLQANYTKETTAYFTRPMFPLVKDTYMLFKGFELMAKKKIESGKYYDSSKAQLIWVQQSLVDTTVKRPAQHKWWDYLHPSLQRRIANRPLVYTEKDMSYNMKAVTDAEVWLHSDGMLCGMRSVVFNVCNMIMPASHWFKSVGPNLIDLECLGMLKRRLESLLTTHKTTAFNIAGCKVEFGDNFGQIKYDTKTKDRDFCKVMMLRTDSSPMSLFLGQQPSSSMKKAEVCSDFAMFGLWSPRNNYSAAFTSIGKEDYTQGKGCDQKEVEVVLEHGVSPFCPVSLAITVRQTLLGEFAGNLTWLMHEVKALGLHDTIGAMVNKGFGKSNFVNMRHPDSADDVPFRSVEMQLGPSYLKGKMFMKLRRNRSQELDSVILKATEVSGEIQAKLYECRIDFAEMAKNGDSFVPVTVTKNNYVAKHFQILKMPAHYNYSPCLVLCYWRSFFGNVNSLNSKLAVTFSSGDYKVMMAGNDHFAADVRHNNLGSNTVLSLRRSDNMKAEALLNTLALDVYVSEGKSTLNVSSVNCAVPDLTADEWSRLKDVMAAKGMVLHPDEDCMCESKCDATAPRTDVEESPARAQHSSVSDKILAQAKGFTKDFDLPDMDSEDDDVDLPEPACSDEQANDEVTVLASHKRKKEPTPGYSNSKLRRKQTSTI